MILSIRGVSKSYGKSLVLNDISLAIAEPKILALVGPNGSGKSTLLNVITNLLKPDKGEVFILGRSNQNADIFKEVSFLQDNSVLYEYLTGHDHLQFIADVQGLSRQAITDATERLGITGYIHKKVGHYSLGMKQHLLVAMAIVNDPKLLILDEPLNGLDPTSAIKIRKLLLELHKEGKTVLVSSHNLPEIDQVTSDILFLKDGRIIEENIRQNEILFYLVSVDQPEKGESVLRESSFPFESVEGKIKLDDLHSLAEIMKKLGEAQVQVMDIEKVKMGTESRYRHLFTKEVE